jgi:hypothetical protein
VVRNPLLPSTFTSAQQAIGRARQQRLDTSCQRPPRLQSLQHHQPDHYLRSVDALPDLHLSLLLQKVHYATRYTPPE